MKPAMRRSINAMVAITGPMTTAARCESSRIEDFRSDMTPTEIQDATACNVRALASQAYLWGLPALLHFRQTTEIMQA